MRRFALYSLCELRDRNKNIYPTPIEEFFQLVVVSSVNRLLETRHPPAQLTKVESGGESDARKYPGLRR